MSDLGAIFHVTADGKQYNAHAYTTTDECPEPNLKVTYKGQQAYIKLVAKGSGDVPCYVKPKSGSTVYQVKKEYVSGSMDVTHADLFTVPAGISVIQVYWSEYEYDDHSHSQYAYVGVTSGKTYKLLSYSFIVWPDGDPNHKTSGGLYLGTPTGIWWQRVPADEIQETGIVKGFTISWSPEINKMKPTYKDY